MIRTPRLLTILALLASLAIIAPVARAAEVPDLRTRTTGSDWPAFLGPTGDSKSTEKGILTQWPEAGPKIIWQRRITEGYAMPAISKGRLFMFDRVRNNNRLVCMKSETGEELWTFEYPTNFEDLLGYSGGPRCSPVVDEDRVYILGGEGVLHCLAAVDGKVIWKKDTSKDFGVVMNFFGVGSTPVIEGDLLIMQVGGSPPGEAANVYEAGGRVKSNSTGIVAFNKKTGEIVYKIADDLASYASPTLATIHGRRYCFMLMRRGLVAFEPATGKIDFQFPWRAASLESVNASNPVVIDDHVFISETYGPGSALLKVKKDGFEVVWSDEKKRSSLKSMQTHWNTVVHVDGYLYGCSGRNPGDSELRCIEMKTGKVMWSVNSVFDKQEGGEVRLTRSSLLLADNHFVCLDEMGLIVLVKVNPEKFEPVATVTYTQGEGVSRRRLIEYPAWAAPILSHGLLYVRGKDRLLCVELIPTKK